MLESRRHHRQTTHRLSRLEQQIAKHGLRTRMPFCAERRNQRAAWLGLGLSALALHQHLAKFELRIGVAEIRCRLQIKIARRARIGIDGRIGMPRFT